MKLFRFAPIFLLLLFFACEPVATFEKPQPASGKDLTGFPWKLTGRYQSPANRAQLIVSKTRIIQLSDHDIKYHQNQLDSATELRGNLLINLSNGESREIKLEGDTIVERHHSQDTLFDLAAGDVLKKFRNNYFLNRTYGKQRWEVKRLLFHNGQLALQEIATKEDLEKLRQLTNASADSIRNFNPTKRQFKKFVKSQGFSSEEVFFRLK